MKGFTLIEVIILLCIVGILGAIAYGSYQEKQKRSDDVTIIQDNPFDGYKNCSIIVKDDYGYEQKRINLPCDQIQGMPQ